MRVGGGAPIVVQSMTNTDTADVESTLQQTLELAEAGSELVRWTVNVPESGGGSFPVIKKNGCWTPAATCQSLEIFTTTGTCC